MGKTLGYGEITVANMTEPFTVMLTNEAQQFATDSNRKVTSTQSYYTDIIVIRGSQERTDYTIGNITSGSGITVSKNSKRVTFSVSAGTTIGADAGVIEIPITLDGQTVKKQFSWSCGKQGPQGVKGNDGNSFAWNMLSETNCGKKHWGTESSGGKYSVEDFITEDNIDAVKLICTEAISTSNWSYVSFKDIKMLKQLKPSTKYTLSYDIKANRSGAISHSICKGDASNFCTNTVVVNNIIGNETWQHISVVLTTNDLKTTPTNEILYLGRNALSKVGYSIIKNLKLVEGDIDTPWSPSQSDIEGKGVVETVQYYLATSQASGVTSSTSGWSTDITTQKLTADKKYLWNCYQTKYSDGTSEPISTPKVIGVYGDKGQNAKNLSITPSSQYFKSTDGGKTFAPNTITIKPTIQGEISFGKWQYSIDGGVSFADVVSGQKGLTINNNVLAVSKDSSLYSDAVTMVTFRAVASDSSFYDTCSIAKIYDVSDIGDGRNLLWNSNFAKTDEAITGTTNSWGLHTRGTNLVASIDTSTKHNGFNTLKTVSAANGDKNSSNDLEWFAWGISERTSDNLHSKNQNYTLSFYAKASVTTDFIVRWGYDAYGADTTRTLTTNWQKYEIKLHQATSAYSITIIFKLLTAGTVWFSEFKLEKGSSATGYSTAPEDVQTAILSTKSEISDVSLKVDKNKQAIEQRVEKTTYEQDLNLVKGDINKANEGLNKWRYEIYPKSLFVSEYQGKSTMDVFAKNTNLTPSQSVLINDTDLSIAWNYDNNYIGYALTFAKFSAAKSVAITFAHDDGAHIYLNGKLIGGSDAYNNKGESLTLGFVKGWNCIEVVVNEGASTEGFKLGTTISAISECQLMNCYYGTPVARQSHITNQLVENTTNIEGVTTTMQKVMTTVGGSDKIDEFVNNYNKTIESEKQFKKTIGETYTTKDEFNGLEIGGRNLLTKDDCNMSKWQNLFPAHCKATNNNYSNHIDYVPTDGEWEIIYKKISVTKGQKYILSFDYKVNKAYNYLSGQKYGVYLSTSVPTNAAPANIITNGQYVIENTVTSLKRGVITFTAPIDTLYIVINGGCIDDNQTGLSFEFNKWKLEKGNKITDWTPAPEDNEINGQNLVSNLPSNWEQGSFVVEDDSKNKTYSEVKVSEKTQIRIKELIPVFGDITISAQAIQNSSKESLNHYVILFDVNKRYMGKHNVNGWNTSFPRMFNCGDAKYIAIALKWGDGTKTQITPSDISQICLKIERGTSATPFTLAPEDVNGKIVNVETIANQTANKFQWIVKSGTSSSNFEITDRLMNLVSANINLDGVVSFMNTAKGDGRKNLYNLDYSSFENVASQEDAICYAKDNGVTSVGIDSSVSYDGDKSLKISYTTANLNSSTTPLYLGSSANNYGCVKIQAGKQYILSCYVKSDSTTGLFMIDIQGHDTPDTKTDGLYLSNIDPRKLPGSSTGVNLSTDWQRAVCAIKVADNATGLYWSVVPLIWGKPSSSSAPKTFNIWVDCIMLEEVDSISNEPGTYILDKETIIDGGSVKADTITGNQILAGSITADKIATDAIKSRNYDSSGGTQGSFLNLGDGSFTSPNLSWDSNGNLIAKNANIIGNLTAGTVGEWKIDKYIYSRDKMFFDINKHNGQSIYNKNSTNNLFLGDGKVSSFYWFTTQNNTFIIENGNSPQYATGPAGISFGTNIAQGQIELYESVYPGNIIQDYEQTSHTSELSISGSKISFSYYDSNGSSFSDSPYTYIMADYARFYGDIFVQGSITTDEGVDVGGKLQASSIATKNGGLIETAGTVYGGGEIQCGGGQMRIIGGNYGILLRNDGSDFYILSTDSGSPWGGWNSKRPFRINLANGIPYFEYGIIIPNENYLLGNGYQLARGTSWGGVCIGDDSKRLRLYGTSIWASHSISTSDENLKENFTTLDQYEEFYMNLNPIGFNYIGDYDGKKTHFGFGAHKIEDILESEGYDADKFAVVTHRPLVQEDIEKRFGKDVTVDIETEYGVSYAEFIALNTHMIQKTRRELTKVKQEKADLEARLQIIEAKLGL
nr:MAG TPA: Minor structural protein 4 [Herelleviridae sp.]